MVGVVRENIALKENQEQVPQIACVAPTHVFIGVVFFCQGTSIYAEHVHSLSECPSVCPVITHIRFTRMEQKLHVEGH